MTKTINVMDYLKNIVGNFNLSKVPNIEIFDIRKNVSNKEVQETQIVLLEKCELRYEQIVTRLMYIVDNINYRNIDSTFNVLNLQISYLIKIEETLEYLTKKSRIQTNGRLFGLRLRCNLVQSQIIEYLKLLENFSMHEQAAKYFKFSLETDQKFRIYNFEIPEKHFEITRMYKEIYQKEDEECN